MSHYMRNRCVGKSGCRQEDLASERGQTRVKLIDGNTWRVKCGKAQGHGGLGAQMTCSVARAAIQGFVGLLDVVVLWVRILLITPRITYHTIPHGLCFSHINRTHYRDMITTIVSDGSGRVGHHDG